MESNFKSTDQSITDEMNMPVSANAKLQEIRDRYQLVSPARTIWKLKQFFASAVWVNKNAGQFERRLREQYETDVARIS